MRNIVWCTDIYEITVSLLRTLSIPEIIKCETRLMSWAGLWRVRVSCEQNKWVVFMTEKLDVIIFY